MGGQHYTGPLSNEDQKLDNLCSGLSKMERCRSEGKNLQLKEFQRLMKKKKKECCSAFTKVAPTISVQFAVRSVRARGGCV